MRLRKRERKHERRGWPWRAAWPAALACALAWLAPASVAAAGAGRPDGAAAGQGGPVAVAAVDSGGASSARAGARSGGHIVVSLGARRLWYIVGADTVLAAKVAVGRGTTFEYGGRTYRFYTPRGRRRILDKSSDPMWIPPDWHYFEKAVENGWTVVELKQGERTMLGDSTWLEMHGDTVGRVDRQGRWRPWTQGMEIVFGDTLYVPPFGSVQRRIPEALGPYKLALGDGYYIHGTNPYDEDSIGNAVSHGCIRMSNDQLALLYPLVRVGTPVYIH